MERLNEISRTVNKILNASEEFFQSKDSTKEILLSFNRATSNLSGTNYLEILLKEDMLNEKDIDLLTIEINYGLKDEVVEISGEFYDSSGTILIEFYQQAVKLDLVGIEKILFSYLEEIKNKYDVILKKYIRE